MAWGPGGLQSGQGVETSVRDTILPDPGGYDTVIADHSSDWTLGAGLDRLQFLGDGGAVGTGNELDNVIINAGTIYGLGGNDLLEASFNGGTLYGGDGNDTLHGDAHGDVLSGGAGNDTLTGNGGSSGITGAR